MRGFTVVYQETYVKTAKLQILGLIKCLFKRIYTDCVHRYWYTIVRGFTVVHQKTYVRNGRDLKKFCVLMWCLKPYTDYVYTTVRGFTVVYQKTYVNNGRGLKICGLMRCLEKELYYWLWVYHGERIHSGIFIKQIQIRTLLDSALLLILICTYQWEDSQWYTIKPTSDLAEDCQV